jgi:diguanylate cyclase (GGDEF)-like protein
MELGGGYWLISTKKVADDLQSNAYLLVEGDEAVLFDPGSVLDSDMIMASVAEIVPLEKVRYIVLHCEDSDVASCLPRLEAAGMGFTVVTQWRTWSLLRYANLAASSYIVEEHGHVLALESGRKLQFIATPYLHFAGAIATYDKKAKVLLSGELFSAFKSEWSPYADQQYIEGMKAYHEYYMPSKDILRPVMELFESLDPAMILPRQGSVIKDDTGTYIDTLAHLECGTLLGPRMFGSRTAKDLEIPLSRLMKRAAALFGPDKAAAIASNVGLEYEIRTGLLSGDIREGLGLWEKLADAICLSEGSAGLSLIEPYLASLRAEFSLPRVGACESDRSASSTSSEDLNLEINRLRELNEQLSRSAEIAQRSLMLDAVTGLNNESYFRSFIEEQASLRLYFEGAEDDVLAVIGIDEGMARIEYQYGPKEVESILRGVGRLIQDSMRKNQVAFRLHGANFALWMPFAPYHEANELCEEIRTRVEASKSFIERVTVSVGLVALADISDTVNPAEAGSTLVDVGLRRLREAKKRGGNSICSSSEISKEVETKAKILIVDDDAVNADVIKTFLENADYAVVEAKDGDEALKKVSEEGFDIIIAELMIPKLDGFMLKESLAKRSGTKDIPFILLSHRKDEAAVVRAYRLGINYYLRKPFLLAELLGMVQNLLTSGTSR